MNHVLYRRYNYPKLLLILLWVSNLLLYIMCIDFGSSGCKNSTTEVGTKCSTLVGHVYKITNPIMWN